jgi:hypothetical protein
VAAEFEAEVAPAGKDQRRTKQREQCRERDARLRRIPTGEIGAGVAQQPLTRQAEALDQFAQAARIAGADAGRGGRVGGLMGNGWSQCVVK